MHGAHDVDTGDTHELQASEVQLGVAFGAIAQAVEHAQPRRPRWTGRTRGRSRPAHRAAPQPSPSSDRRADHPAPCTPGSVRPHVPSPTGEPCWLKAPRTSLLAGGSLPRHHLTEFTRTTGPPPPALSGAFLARRDPHRHLRRRPLDRSRRNRPGLSTCLRDPTGPRDQRWRRSHRHPLGDVTFMDSSGVLALAAALQTAPQRLRLGTVHPAVRRVLDVTALLDVFVSSDEISTP